MVDHVFHPRTLHSGSRNRYFLMSLRPAWSAYNGFQDRDRDKPLLSPKKNQLTNIKPKITTDGFHIGIAKRNEGISGR